MKTKRLPLLWRWTLRDMRERWMQVVGIAFIIALGVALYSGLGSTIPWRIKSFKKSYDQLNAFDLRLELTPGSYLEAERLKEITRSIPHTDWIEDVSLRLRVPTSVEAVQGSSSDSADPERTVLVSGEIIGMDVSGSGPAVNKIHVTSGRGLEADDAGAPVCIVERNFAGYHGLTPDDWTIRVSGGKRLQPVGVGIATQFFMVVEEGSAVLGAFAQDRFAALFVPLETARELAGLPGQANELLITVADGVEEAELDQLKAELEDAMAQTFPEVSATLEKRSESQVYELLYNDISGDQEIFDTISSILLLGAAFGAFILIGRIVDAQRREIGINMAIGVPRLRISRRYLLIGAQIAFLGVVFGVVLGFLINQPLGAEVTKMLPLPYFDTSFQVDIFVQGALIGVLVPFLAILYPIWRAVRVPPIEAIQTSYLISQGGGLAPLMAHVSLPGSSFAQMPIRNLSRGLRRTVMTVLGLSMAIIVLIAVIGMIDTFQTTLDTGSRELKQDAPDRTLVTLDNFYPLSGTVVSQVASSSHIAQAVPSILVPGELSDGEKFEVLVQLLDLDNALWTPTIIRGDVRSPGPGILINEKAAQDLGVDVGDTVTLRHPYRESRHALRMAESQVQVVGIHADILRTAVYMDIQDAGLMNLEGLVNSLHVNPTAGTRIQTLQQALIQVEQVGSVRRVSSSIDAIEELLNQYIGIFQALQFIVLIMAFFIAFNTTRSNIDERRRDIATMFAFGTRIRTVLRMTITENFITGVLGTIVGVALGWLLMNTTLASLFENEAPELRVVLDVSPVTYGWAVFIGVVVVALTPVLLTRRLIKMDVPSTLRVIE